MKVTLHQVVVLGNFMWMGGLALGQNLPQGTAVVVGPSNQYQWNNFNLTPQSNYWNGVGISSTIDYDIQTMCNSPTNSQLVGNACDFVVAVE